jgi:hypothetical protein
MRNDVRPAADGGGLLENRARVLLILSESVLGRARVLAGKATVKLKLPVSLQITLRALIEQGLKQENHPALLANIEAHAHAIRRSRTLGRRRRRPDGDEPQSRTARESRRLNGWTKGATR